MNLEMKRVVPAGSAWLMMTVVAFLCVMTAAPVAAAPSPAAPVIEMSWSAQFPSPVLWERVTPLGRLVVCTAEALQGVDPDTGKVVWRHPSMGGVAAEAYQDDPSSSLIQIREQRSGEQLKSLMVLDPVDGHLVFDSRAARFSEILTARVLHRARALLVVGVHPDGSNKMLLLDNESGNVAWSRNDLKAGGTAQMAGLMAMLARNLGGMNAGGRTHEIDAEHFLYLDYGTVANIETRTGRVLWQTDHRSAPDSTRLFFPPKRGDLFILGGEIKDSINGTPYVGTQFMAHRMADGRPLWSEPVEFKEGLGEVIFTDRGILLSNKVRTSGRIKMVEYATGRSLWGKKGKGIETPGTVFGYDEVAGGLAMAFGTDSAWDNAGVEYVLNILDLGTGDFRFKSDLKVKGALLRTEVLPRGILYVTTAEMNVLDIATGKPLNPRLLVRDGRLVVADGGRQVYAFAHDDGILHRLDKNTGRMEPLSRIPVKLGDKDRPDALEMGSDRVTLVSSQNIVAFGLDGSVKFHAHYAAPRLPAALRILAAANAFNAAMTSVASAAMAGALAQATTHQAPGSPEQNMTALIAEGYGQVAQGAAGASRQSAQIASTRFKASAHANTHIFMLVSFPKEGIGLAKVSKVTGQIDGRIMLGRDREPEYQVDLVGKRLYYRSAPGQILGYSF